MNKIVREHYPVANLPEDLRAEFAGLETVTVSIHAEAENPDEDNSLQSFVPDRTKQRSPQESVADLQRIRNSGLPSVTSDEAVRRIRELRDEWDDE